MLAFVFTEFVFNSFCCLSANVFSSAFGSVFTYVMFLFSFQLSPLSYFLCCIVPLCHFSASLCFCYPSFCLLYHFVIQYLLTFLVLVLGNYFDFYFFIFVHIYTYYGMVGCMTCADALLDLVVCVCLFRICIYLRLQLA